MVGDWKGVVWFPIIGIDGVEKVGTGVRAEAIRLARMAMAKVKKIHVEITASIDVVVFLKRVENIRLRASQNPT